MFEGKYMNDKKLIGKQYDKNGNIICEINNTNGKGKEYDDIGNLIFEGDYLNCERNEQGKKYYREGQLLFEGEYLNGKRDGEGKELFNNDKLKFKGKYMSDKEWEGKGYDLLGNFIYELKGGKGYKKDYYPYGILKFEGEYLNG